MKKTLSRSGLGLVELMIVIAIIVTLAAVVLPTFKTALKDQKITQATRQVKGFFEAARSKAIAGGRPVGVLLDRVSYTDIGVTGDGGDLIPKSTCVRLSLVEVLPPYTGDLQGATAVLTDPSNVGHATVARLSKYFCPAAVALIRNGDLISFGNNPTKFYVTGIIDPNPIDSNTPYAVSFINPPWATEPQWRTDSGTFELPFRVYRKASKSLAGSLTLPRGICIDLSGSGIGPTGRDFAIDRISAAILSGSGTLPPTGNYGAVYVIFGENGNVDHVFPSPSTLNGNLTLSTYDSPLTTIHFLLGKTDQVSPANVLSPFDGTQVVESRDALVGNLMDPESSWVSINPFNGNIYSSKVGGVVVPATPSNFTIPFRTLQARQFAGQVSAEGGR